MPILLFHLQYGNFTQIDNLTQFSTQVVTLATKAYTKVTKIFLLSNWLEDEYYNRTDALFQPIFPAL